MKQWLAYSQSASMNQKILWIHGAPGFGKTILCSHIVDLLKYASRMPVAHYFFSSDLESRNDPWLAIRSWITQIIAQDEDAYAYVGRTMKAESSKLATRVTIVALFEKLVQMLPGCVFVLDGIDECTDLKEVRKFLQRLSQIASEASVRILVVSRDEVEIRHALNTFPEYRIEEDDNSSDLSILAQDIVNEKFSDEAEDFRAAIVDMLTRKCEGQFLWIFLQGDLLKRGEKINQLSRAIEKVSPKLEDCYSACWRRIEKLPLEERERVEALLRWSLFAFRPLTVCEIAEASL